MELAGYSRKTGWNGDSGWVSDTQAGVTDLTAAEVSLAKYNAGPSPLAVIYVQLGAEALKEGGEKEVNGEKCTLITVEGFPIQFYVNRKTKMLDGMSIPGNLEVTFQDHTTIDGVQFAGKSTMQLDAPKMTMVSAYKTTKINSEIDATKFKRPSSHSEPAPATPATENATVKQIISYLDKNGDGKISKDEAPEQLKENFGYIDTNGDGVIDTQEAQVMASYAKQQPAGSTQPTEVTGRVTAKQLIGSMDKNGDGKIGKNEASEDLKLFFGDIDANGDGVIDVREAQVMAEYANDQEAEISEPAPAAERVTAKQLISSMDKNGDGKISKDEAPQEVKTNFHYIDKNGDGVIDLEEAQVMADCANQQTRSTEPTPAKGRYTARQVVDSMDRNGDGKISKDEASEDLKPYFQQQDSNGDGAIDVKEAQVIADYLNNQPLQ